MSELTLRSSALAAASLLRWLVLSCARAVLGIVCVCSTAVAADRRKKQRDNFTNE